MGKAGRKETVSDERLLLEFLLTSDPALFTSEIAVNLPLTKQRVNQRLDDLETDDGYVTSKKASGRRLWWMTPEGHEHIAAFARERLR